MQNLKLTDSREVRQAHPVFFGEKFIRDDLAGGVVPEGKSYAIAMIAARVEGESTAQDREIVEESTVVLVVNSRVRERFPFAQGVCRLKPKVAVRAGWGVEVRVYMGRELSFPVKISVELHGKAREVEGEAD